VSSEQLENRYRLLLRAYPSAYRRERGDELIEAVLASEDTARHWPSPRQATALITGGLRARRNPTRGRAGTAAWWQGIELATIALITYAGAIIAGQVYASLSILIVDGYAVSWLAQSLAAASLLAALLVTLIGGYRRTAAGVALTAVVVPTLLNPHPLIDDWTHVEWWAPIVALPLILAGARRPATVPQFSRRSRLGLLGLCALVIAATVISVSYTSIFDDLGRPFFVVLALALVTVVYGFIDPRPLIAIAALALPGLIATVATGLNNGASIGSFDPLGMGVRPAIVIVALTWVAIMTRREAQL
jgi:hypothetical protein